MYDYIDPTDLAPVQIPDIQPWLSRCEESTLSVATCGPNHTDNWQFSTPARRCGASRLSTAEARKLLKQKWVVMAGDSITRFLFAALLRLLADDGELLPIMPHPVTSRNP